MVARREKKKKTASAFLRLSHQTITYNNLSLFSFPSLSHTHTHTNIDIMADKRKALVYNICEFLKTSIQDGSIRSDDVEGVEVAIECIGEAFGVNTEAAADQEQYSIKPTTLLSIFDVFLKTREKSKASSAPSPAAVPAASTSPASSPSADDKAKAEALKTEGNSLMTSKSYPQAIAKYTEAIALNDTNPVYFSNRAAAYSSAGDHQKAIEDSEKALKVDPSFVKAYSRLGHAQYSLSQFPKAVETYRKGLLLDPTNTNLKAALNNAQARCPSSSSDSEDDEIAAPATRAGGAGAGAGAGGMPDLSSLMGMLGGGGGGGGGMPDIGSLLKNPQMMAMAQQMMANGGLEKMMANPAIRGMAERMQNGGGPPSMAEMMNDPALKEAAAQFGAGQP